MKQARLEALRLAVGEGDRETTLSRAEAFVNFIENGYSDNSPARKRRVRNAKQETDDGSGQT
jgi:hypothetical protein